mmetsp:Transcript_1056/g.2471  ORF Transcript_1056/g.2471 Transcript_1056/m.2471 type:complete len:259 (-) Transcript_1056:169-945(-)|eukprot:CAMPEP_0198236076 /NCGR_PEP_ID=MMETSP1446-20131203/1980_1 /TAXON_ID=1461542 ORGANISM="Unidentified sp, Strain CCMP2111" /NCGR_SAMPLE_ID=MMETSP1446 /ASSEMBLY_ACC=CAM_ASM_001112 /LENGTH=258 /DNA_ID=CAMNT_0043917633 /DNA_START=294 /DNA_END=1070 /DNA_ORIENTATION=-
MSGADATTTDAPVEGNAGSEELKHLGFVKDYGNKASELGNKLYESAKNQVPSSFKPKIETMESTIKAYSAPITEKVQSAAPKVLTNVDQKVDQAKVYLENYLGNDNVRAFHQTRAEYLKQIESVLEEIRTKGVSGSLNDATQKAVDNLTAAVADIKKYATEGQLQGQLKDMQAKMMDKVNEYWAVLAANPSVSSIVKVSMDKVEVAKESYLSAHEKLVSHPAYGQFLQTSAEYLGKVQESEYYKKVVDHFKPMPKKPE